MIPLRLVNKIQESPLVQSFIFMPEVPVSWRAGQSLRLEVPVGYDIHERRFSIATAPHEKVVMITTKKSDSLFKQQLWGLPLGASVAAFSIEGTFAEVTEQPLVLLAGGVGISAFRALLTEAAYTGSKQEIALLHTGSDKLFAKDIQAWRSTLKNALLIQQSERLSGRSLQTVMRPNAHYLIAGPAGMLRSATEQLNLLGVDQSTIVYESY